VATRSSFYGQISANKRNSLFMAAFVVGIFALLGFTIGYAIVGSPAGGVAATALALGIGSISGVATYFSGDKLVLTVSGARRVDEATAPQLLNVVRELALAADLPMPAVYTIDDTAPNAFATGRDPEHASIAITTGLLEKLDREELQGVIGELSHVRNLDIRFSLVVGGVMMVERRSPPSLPTSSFASRSGAGCRRGARTVTAGVTGPRRSSRSSPSSWPSWRRSSAGSSSSP
jgi:Zn-dependent protease with chaperone function